MHKVLKECTAKSSKSKEDFYGSKLITFKYSLNNIFKYAVVVSPDSSTSEVGFVLAENYLEFIETHKDNTIAPYFDCDSEIISMPYYTRQGIDYSIFNTYSAKATPCSLTTEDNKLNCLFEVHAFDLLSHMTKNKKSEIDQPPKAFFEAYERLMKRVNVLASGNALTEITLDKCVYNLIDTLNLSKYEKLSCYVHLARLCPDLFKFVISSKAPKPCNSYKELCVYDFKVDRLDTKDSIVNTIKVNLTKKYSYFLISFGTSDALSSSVLDYNVFTNPKPSVIAAWGRGRVASEFVQHQLEISAQVILGSVQADRGFRGAPQLVTPYLTVLHAVERNYGKHIRYYNSCYAGVLGQLVVNNGQWTIPDNTAWASPYYVLHEAFLPYVHADNLCIPVLSNMAYLDLVYIGSTVKTTGAFSIFSCFKNLVWLSSTALSASALILAWQFKATIYCAANTAMADLILSLKHFGYKVNILNTDLSEINTIIDKARGYCNCPMYNVTSINDENLNHEMRAITGIPESIEINVQFIEKPKYVNYIEKENEHKKRLCKILTNYCVYDIFSKTYKACDVNSGYSSNKREGVPVYKVCERLISEVFKDNPLYSDVYTLLLSDYLSILNKIKQESPDKYALMHVHNNKIYGEFDKPEYFSLLYRRISALLSLTSDWTYTSSLYFVSAKYWVSYLKTERVNLLRTYYLDLKSYMTSLNSENNKVILENLDYYIHVFKEIIKILPDEFDAENLLEFKAEFIALLSDKRAKELAKIFAGPLSEDSLWELEEE